jgi:ribosomal protein L3 glutamine methyltransferase
MNTPIDELITIRDWLRWAVSRFVEADLHFGHGTDNAHDEAAWLILHALRLPQDRLEQFLDARLTRDERLGVLNLLEQRIVRRLPAAYLTGEAWLCGYRFHVDPRVIVPRSYFGELLVECLAPWVEDPFSVTTALDLCTGSGCLAIIMADVLPNARIDAVDISADALDVARRNIAEHGREDRVRLVRSDLLDGLADRRYDLIVCNPPYVTAESMARLPAEYRHEPTLALGAGEDGLDVVRRLLAGAADHLSEKGVLFVEVGHNADIVESAFPDLPFTWIDSASADGKVFMLYRDDLVAA